MDEQAFKISSHAELAALFRATMEGKFSRSPRDLEIMESPIVAKLLNELCEAVHAADQKFSHRNLQGLQDEWRSLRPDREEWAIALEYARNRWREDWGGWDDKTRQQRIAVLVAPFVLTLEARREFADLVAT